jgi:hypothetical protein
MTTHTIEDLHAMQRVNAILILCEALRSTAHLEPCNPQKRSQAMAAYIDTVPNPDRLSLMAFISLPPPVQRPKAPNGHADGLKREGSADHRRI